MRHSNSGRKLSRTPSHRKALLQNLAKALIAHGRIRTTELKAKELRRVVEPLVTLAAKQNDVASRRLAFRVLVGAGGIFLSHSGLYGLPQGGVALADAVLKRRRRHFPEDALGDLAHLRHRERLRRGISRPADCHLPAGFADIVG